MEKFYSSPYEAALELVEQYGIPQMVEGVEQMFMQAAEQGEMAVEVSEGKPVVSRTEINNWFASNKVEYRILSNADLEFKKILSSGGRRLDNKEIREFIKQPFYMGTPQVVAYSGRGRRSTKTQYDEARERRKGYYHRLERLPKSGAEKKKELGAPTRKRIKDVARELLPIVQPHNLVSRVVKELEENGWMHDKTYIREVLKDSGMLPAK